MTDLLARRFIADGFVKIENAVPSEVAQACAELLWAEIKKDPDDEATWTQPVYWVGDMAQEPFVQAANASVLHEAFDALVGPGRWVCRGIRWARSRCGFRILMSLTTPAGMSKVVTSLLAWMVTG